MTSAASETSGVTVAAAPTEDDGGARDAMFSAIYKAIGNDSVDGGGVAASNLRAREEEQFTELGALPNPYPPEMLVRIYERSSALRPCIDALVTNVHGFGFRLVPRINLSAQDADAEIASAILSERLYAGEDDPDDPTPEEIELRKAEIGRGMEREKLRLQVFFENCNPDGFGQFRQQLATDLETTGNAYMEARRDSAGRVARLAHAPSTNMRLQKLERDPLIVDRRVRISPIQFADEKEPHQFRGFVQIVNAYTTYFKEFGDPRVMSAQSGRFYTSIDVMPKTDTPATEILHLKVFSSRTSYGIARWIGAAFEVLGIRAASEVNYLYFDNKGVPPLAILVSGGALNKGSATAITKHIEANHKGRQNFHSILVLEAQPAAGGDPAAAGRVRIAIQPLTDAQQKDGLFQEYSDNAEEVVGRQFRLPPIVRGKSRDYTRATAQAALQHAEQQVFQPERQSFDERFDRTILTDHGIRYWRMESNSPVATDPEVMTKLVDTLVKNGTMTPAEARQFVNAIMNADLPPITAGWGQQPLQLTLGGIPPELTPSAEKEAAGGAPGADAAAQARGLANHLTALRDRLQAQGDGDFEAALEAARKEEGFEVVRIQIPAEEMAKMVRETPAASGAGRAGRWPAVDSASDDGDD